MKEFDLIIYGATGFTGQKVVHEIGRNPPKKDLKWAIAGRDIDKLLVLLDSIDTELVGKPMIIQIGIDDQQLLETQVKRFKVLINCVGPFRLYGRPVVEACVSQKTDYVDICGEPEFIESVFADLNKDAIENEVALIPACGYDSLPADLGTLFAKEQFHKKGAVCSQVEMFVQMNSGPSGVCGNATTFISAVLGFASVGNLKAIRKKSHRVVQYLGQDLQIYRSTRWDPRVSGYTIPLAVADIPVVKLGQQIVESHKDLYATKYRLKKYQPPVHPPVRIAGYFSLSFIGAAYLIFIGSLLKMTTYLPFLSTWLIKYPEFFTLGVFKKSGPTSKQLDEQSFKQTFISKGYLDGKVDQKPNLQIITIVKGPEMGYVTTPITVSLSAALLLKKRDLIPNGVLTPAVAFSNVSADLYDALHRRGINFQVESITEI